MGIIINNIKKKLHLYKLNPKDLKELIGQDILIKLPIESDLLHVRVFSDKPNEYEFLVNNRKIPPIKSIKTDGTLKNIHYNIFCLVGDYGQFHYFGDVNLEGYEKRKAFLEGQILPES